MVPALCGYPLQTDGFSGLSPLSRFPGLHRETTNVWAPKGTELYVIEQRGSVTRRMRPLKPAPRFDMSGTTTRKEDGHERHNESADRCSRPRRLC
jgi:hypothetical protein